VPGLRYVIVGGGEERPRLEALVDQLDLRERVRFEGMVSDEDLPKYYAACDVFVHPNRLEEGDFEGFGIVFLEAQATAKPVIGGRSGGVSEAVADGESGFLVSGTDVVELADVVRRLACSADLRRRLGAAGRARVESAFTWDVAAKKVRALHDKILSRNQPGAL
jgi:phosphatidylinositol alpha-1,6-mannosyltransferase